MFVSRLATDGVLLGQERTTSMGHEDMYEFIFCAGPNRDRYQVSRGHVAFKVLGEPTGQSRGGAAMQTYCNADEPRWFWVSAFNGELRMGTGTQMFRSQLLVVEDKVVPRLAVRYIGIEAANSEIISVCAAPCQKIDDWTNDEANNRPIPTATVVNVKALVPGEKEAEIIDTSHAFQYDGGTDSQDIRKMSTSFWYQAPPP